MQFGNCSRARIDRICCTSVVVLCIICSRPAAAGATEKNQPNPSVETIKLQIEPAREPVPALKYTLLPSNADRVAGDAAKLYVSAEIRSRAVPLPAYEWLRQPLADMPRDEVRTALTAIAQAMDEVDAAARLDSCDWELPIRGNPDPLSIQFDVVINARRLGLVLAVQARLQMLDGEFRAAIRTLQTGFSLSRDVGNIPLAVPGLVGLGITNVMTERIRELSEQPGAPSLYWALSALPSPIIDFGPAFDMEGSQVYDAFPFLRDAENAQRTPDEWQELLENMTLKLTRWKAISPPFGINVLDRPPAAQALLTVWAMKGYPRARRHLLQKGLPASKVNEMPVGQAIAICTADLHDRLRDEFLKWQRLPWPEADKGLKQADEMRVRSKEIIPIAETFLFAFRNRLVASRGTDRRIAELRLIEALRLYAGTHDGALPPALSNVTVVPVPIDPTTGKNFNYRLEEGTAVIEIDDHPEVPGSRSGTRYELTVRPRR